VETAVRDDGRDGFLRPVTNECSASNSPHTIAVAVAVAIAVAVTIAIAVAVTIAVAVAVTIYLGRSFGEFDANSIKKAPNGTVPGFEQRRVKQ
jgi:hypothetical protein